MKIKVLIGGLIAVMLFVAACTATDTANKTTTNTTTTTTTTSGANRPAATNTNTATTTNTSNTSTTSNTSADTSSDEGGKQDFTLHNETGVEIHSLYVSPHGEDEWGPDILGRDTLPSGEAVEITFSPKEKAANWDLKVTDQSNNSIEWENLNLMEISTVTLHYSNGKATAEVK